MLLSRIEKQARRENFVLRFLVERCEEGEGFETSGQELSDAYWRFYTKNSTRQDSAWLSNEQLYRLLTSAGIQSYTKDTLVKTRTRKQRVFRNVRLKQLPPSQDVLSVEQPLEVFAVRKKKTEKGELPPIPCDPNVPVILNDGSIFTLGMFAGVKALSRPFKCRFGTDRVFTHVLRFKDQSMKDIWLTEDLYHQIKRKWLGV